MSARPHDPKNSAMKFVRGGQLFFYNIKMFMQVSARIGFWAIAIYLLIVAGILSFFMWPYRELLAMQLFCRTLHLLFLGFMKAYTSSSGASFTADYWLNDLNIQRQVGLALLQLKHYLLLACLIGGVAYGLMLYFWSMFFIKKGDRYTGDTFISGTQVEPSRKNLIKAVGETPRGVSALCLFGDIPLPYKAEFQGIFIHGAPGTGKSQTIMEIMDFIRSQNEPAIIYDKECTFKPYFYQEGVDHELNPLSEDCENWSLWDEIDNPLELADLFSFLIQKAVQGTDPFWVDSARGIATDTAWQIRDHKDKSPIMLLQLLLTTTLEELRAILKGTASENLVSEEIAKTAISIKSVLATYTKSLRFLEGLNTTGKPEFSIKKWLKRLDDVAPHKQGWLFITSRAEFHHEIKPLLTLWMGLALKGIQSRSVDHPRRIWLIMDELASLQHLDRLSTTLADVRKFGGCVAVGVQSMSQLDFLYGNHESTAIQDLFSTSIYARSPKAHIADRVSRELGSQQVDEVRESQSYGPSSVRDGNTISHQRVTRRTVDPTEVMTLKDMQFYLRLRGISKIGLLSREYLDRKAIAKGFVQRTVDFDALSNITDAIKQAETDPSRENDVKKQQAYVHVAERIAKDPYYADDVTEKRSQGIDIAPLTPLSTSIEQRESSVSEAQHGKAIY